MAGLWGLRYGLRSVGARVDTVVVEFDLLDYGVAAIWSDAVDEGDDAFSPLFDVDVLGMSIGFDRNLCRGLGLLDRVRIAIGFDGDAVVGAQPKGDLDNIFGHCSGP